MFNISTDNVKQTPVGILDELGEAEVHIGDFFDEADCQYLRRTETVHLNKESSLIPSNNVTDSVINSSTDNDLSLIHI